MGLAVKLDTNGFYPDILGEILAEKLIDYAAIDIKAPPEKYALLCGLPSVDMSRFNRSLDLLIESKIAHEFRTTVVPTLLTEKDVAAISHWLPPQSPYILQQFRPQNCLDPAYNELVPYPADVLRRMQAIAQKTLSKVTVRGI
jgi:pyruvate formate lyase activating enzyme